jgi:3-oxoacyl-[acyl-carrier protein] reductase
MLEGRVAVITGSSRGIGLSIARCFAQEGANIILNGRAKAGDELALELSNTFGVEACYVCADVATPDGAQKIAKAAFSKYRRIDVLVNNAGVLRDALIGMITEEDVDDTLAVNLRSVIAMTNACARLLYRSKSPSIINISSIIGTNGNSGQVVYGASKAGVIGATKSAAKELAEKGVRVNCIAPGYINTDMIKDIPAEIHSVRMSSIPMKRVGEPSDVANAALFFASDSSAYVTGQVLGVDGGMLI